MTSAPEFTLGQPSITPRWTRGLVLGGFMERGAVQPVVGEWLISLNATEQAAFWTAYEVARAAVRGLGPTDLVMGVVSEPTAETAGRGGRLLGLPEVVNAFPGLELSFGEVNLAKVIPLQNNVRTVAQTIPGDPEGLAAYCLPEPTNTPAEVSFTMNPLGGSYATFLSDVPYGGGLIPTVEAGRLSFAPPRHINLLQVAEFSGRWYLRNGTNRAVALLRAGLSTAPALLVKGGGLPQLQLGGPGIFPLTALAGQARPPLLGDFTGPAAVEYKSRDRRYGTLVRFEMAPLNPGR